MDEPSKPKDKNTKLDKALSALRAEHELLDATFETLALDCGTAEVPARYGDTAIETDAFEHAAALADLTGSLSCALLHGTTAACAFTNLVFAGKILMVGECAFEAQLQGDGVLVAAPLIARTGDNEYLVIYNNERACAANSWLQFLAGIKQSDYAPFAGLSIEEVSYSLVPLLIAGPAARKVLADYVSDTAIPLAGRVDVLKFDSRIPVLTIGLPKPLDMALLLFLPPGVACALWRSLMSFRVIVPTGYRAVLHWLSTQLDWYEEVKSDRPLAWTRTKLRCAGLLRDDHDYVGARALVE